MVGGKYSCNSLDIMEIGWKTCLNSIFFFGVALKFSKVYCEQQRQS